MNDRFRLDAPTFDTIGSRQGLKWAQTEPGVIPAWVADMDFPTAPAIVEAVTAAATDLTYPSWLDEPTAGPLATAFAERMEQRYGWSPDPGHVRAYSDINQSLQVILHLLTRPGDSVAIHVPAYHPFLDTLTEMGRPPLAIPMNPDGGSWSFDAERLDAELANGRCRVLLLVNPHNPTGHAFTGAELTALAELAVRHDLLVLADEIHADLIFAPGVHLPFATLVPERTITLTSATKAFNLGGLRCSVAHVGSPTARRVLAEQPAFLYGTTHVLGVAATVAAWRLGDPWLEEVLTVLDRNRRLIAERLPERVGYRVPDATYLAWLDLTAQDLPEDPAEFIRREAKVLLSPGPLYGPGGDGHARLNFATSAPILDEALTRISAALT
ncbi:aminotransferase class I/II-fold pyridoxal phosphate-dependent enzyme [Streptosporangium soli]|nr:aminotransferase class I/II-fold pyridoxal phosphate-dependent enzyme [Streptosporangium sp. KLBMP 9127]